VIQTFDSSLTGSLSVVVETKNRGLLDDELLDLLDDLFSDLSSLPSFLSLFGDGSPNKSSTLTSRIDG
jgi:hypothetical protein